MTSQLPEVVQALLNPKIYPELPAEIHLVQTQMSFVFLAGEYAYKIKKPVNLGYLDYTTLGRRKFFCEQELKLNRRLCEKAYLEVIPIVRTPSGISLGGDGTILEYAVKMRRLPQERILSALLEHNQVETVMLLPLAIRLVEFHARAQTGPQISTMGTIASIRINTDENFTQTEKYIGQTITEKLFRQIKEFTENTLQSKARIFNQRVSGGRIRDCHGDLHAGHICFENGICVFDCIEFNDRFRYCDVASEIAFLAMDIDHHGRADLSRSFTKAYIEYSQDYQISEILKFYKCYRAYVRGKVNCFKYDDPYITGAEKQRALEDARSYFDLAGSYTRSKPLILITIGLVGTGKTTLANALAKRLGLTVISSDIIRKQLAGIPPTEHRFEAAATGIYSAEFTHRTYERMFTEAKSILNTRDSVILDASFINRTDRIKAMDLAKVTNAEFMAIQLELDEESVRKRLNERLKGTSVSDGRWEIYYPQKQKFDAVDEIPFENHLVIDASAPLNEQVNKVVSRII